MICVGGQDFCRILVMSEEDTQCGSKLAAEASVDASVICHKPVDIETLNPFPSCLVTVDIEKGTTDVSNMDQEICGSIKTEVSLTVRIWLIIFEGDYVTMILMRLAYPVCFVLLQKPLRRQNSLQIGGESIPPLMNHILMLLKFDAKGNMACNLVVF